MADKPDDGVALESRAHTLTRIGIERTPREETGADLIVEFAAVRLGVRFQKGYTPQECVAKLHELIDLIESNFT